MDVEVFDERELNPATLTVEPDEEALKLIAELGLAGQQTEEDEPKRICYPQPTQDQVFIIGTLFPKRTDAKKYAAGAIPLRVLKEMRSYLAENPTHSLFVCHQAPAIVSDPVLMAYPAAFLYGDPQHCDMDKCRMIARWGDALKPWSELLGVAMTSHRKAVRDALTGIIAKAKAYIAHLDEGCAMKTPRRPGNMPQILSMPDEQ
jgi:hypothetical protein